MYFKCSILDVFCWAVTHFFRFILMKLPFLLSSSFNSKLRILGEKLLYIILLYKLFNLEVNIIHSISFRQFLTCLHDCFTHLKSFLSCQVWFTILWANWPWHNDFDFGFLNLFLLRRSTFNGNLPSFGCWEFWSYRITIICSGCLLNFKMIFAWGDWR